MPRKIGVSVENNFTKGLITEATGLKFPENAATETDNCVFNHKGVVSRRLGFDYEESSTPFTVDIVGRAFSTFVWKNVAEEGDLTFVVVQMGASLYFYRVAADSSLSEGKHATAININSFLPSGAALTSMASIECQFTAGNGILFVTNPKTESFYVEYNVAGNSFTSTAITVRVRDFEGDNTDALAVDNRPTSTKAALTAAHTYNLLNQGWLDANLTAWDTARTDMPSNCDVSWYFKSATDAFDFSTVADRAVGNSKAPSGHFIYSLYNINRATNFAGATEFSIVDDRLSTCAFFAGRVFYAGLKYQGFNSKIYFTQILERKDQYGRCYQVNDPTSEQSFDLLPSDGGFIDLIEAGNILKMVPFLNTLIVFCTNGVWAITGSQGTGFTANDFSVVKLSAVENVSHNSFVLAEDKIFWWTHTGIYTVTRDPQTNALGVQSITLNTIKEFFEDIPLTSRESARGCYDSLNRRVQWLYRSTATDSFQSTYEFDRVLNLNLITGAFYPWTIDDATNKLKGVVSVTGAGGTQVSNQVVAGANNIVVGADNVIVFSSVNSSIDSVTKFFTHNGTQVSWAEEYRDTYLDWTSTDYVSDFITGYRLRGEGLRKHQTNYLRLYSDNTNPSTFSVKAVWDYALDGVRGRVSESQQVGQIVTMSDPVSYGVKTRRLKIRGHGLACQLEFTSVTGEPFDIIGWTSLDSSNSSP